MVDMIVKSWISPKVELRKSSIHGEGLFAIEKIAKDEVIAYKGGYLLQAGDFNKLPDDCKTAGLQVDDAIFLAPKSESEAKGVMIGINHSCSPNVGICGQIDTTAMRDIELGEELTGDYVVAYQNEYFNFTCNCGSKNCRGVVTSDDWKNPVLQQRYNGYFSMYLQKMIDNEKREKQ